MTNISVELSMLIFNRVRDKMAAAGRESVFTRVGGEVVSINMDGVLLIQESKSETDAKTKRTVAWLLDMVADDSYERAERMSNEVLLEALCTITARKGETRMEDAVVTTVCDRVKHPFTWRLARCWKKLRGRL